jgi:hypothetical protein
MPERRPLIEGVKPKPDPNRALEAEFVYGDKAKAATAQANPAQQAEQVAVKAAPPTSRVPFTTRVRTDIAQALKRASLERQLEGVEPNTVQDILEAALEPWLKANGYLS